MSDSDKAGHLLEMIAAEFLATYDAMTATRAATKFRGRMVEILGELPVEVEPGPQDGE